MRLLTAARVGTFAAVAVICFYRLGAVPLYETDEGFAGTRADSFYRHHSLLLTYDDYDTDQPQFRKPPLLYWMVAGLYEVLGRTLWAVRLPTAVASFFVCVLMYLIIRRYLGEWTALAAAALPCTIRFVLFHMRTAMLDMPLLFCVLLAVYCYAFRAERIWPVIIAGLTCGAAVLVKGASGFLALFAAVVFGLIRRKFTGRAWRDALVLCVFCAAPLLIYDFLLPAEYRMLELFNLFIKEGRARTLSRAGLNRMPAFYRPFLLNVRWHAVAGLLGTLIVIARIPKRKALLEWLCLVAIIALPVVMIGVEQVMPYHRYFLPVYPLALALSAYFAFEVCGSRGAAWLLIPFAAGCYCFRDDPSLRWIPIAVAAVLFTARQIRPVAAQPWFNRVAGLLLLAAIAVPASLSPTGRACGPRADQQPRPDLIPLAELAGRLVPPSERLIMGTRFTCHTVLFYGRRAMWSYGNWLLSHFEPGVTRYGIFRTNQLQGIPYVDTSLVAENGPWKLLKITTSPAAHGVRGILEPEHNNRENIRRTLALLDVGYNEVAGCFILTNIVDYGETQYPAAEIDFRVIRWQSMAPVSRDRRQGWELDKGDALYVGLRQVVNCCGLDVNPASRRAPLTGFTIEAFDPSGAGWQTLRSIEGDFAQGLCVENGRMKRTPTAALRLRFPPVRTAKLRIVRTGDPPTRLWDVTVFVAGRPAGIGLTP